MDRYRKENSHCFLLCIRVSGVKIKRKKSNQSNSNSSTLIFVET